MPDFLKKLYAFPFTAGTWIYLAVSGLFAYLYFFMSGFKPSRLRSFLYFQGRVLQSAVLFASVFRKQRISFGLPNKPQILIANHPSTYDTFVFFDFGIKNLICIAKGWPFKIPLYGRFIKEAGYINSDGKSAQEIVDLARIKFEQGLHVAIFPEGTRSVKIGRFRSLAFEIAIKTGVNVVPFVIKGLGEMLPPGNVWAKKADIEYVQLEPVSFEKFATLPSGALRMAQYCKSLIAQELKKGENT